VSVSPGEIATLAGIAVLGSIVFGITGFGAALVTIPLATHLCRCSSRSRFMC
jgi:uncharacterized membrane protein YfcA